MLGGYALARAWQSGPAFRAVAAVLAAAYLTLAVPQSYATARWQHDRSRRVERLVLGVERAAELHPGSVILLDGVDDELFWIGVLDQPFRLFGASVFLTPGTEANIQPHPDYGDPAAFVLPAEASMKALNNGTAVVYAANAPRLRNITKYYADVLESKAGAQPRRVDVGNPLLAYLLGPDWHQPDQGSRWMPRRATLRIGGPTAPGQKLYLTGYLPEQQAAQGPLELSASADGIPLGTSRVSSEGRFDLTFPLPPQLVGRRSIELAVEAGRTFRAAGDGRDLSLIFGVFEIK